MSTRLAKQGLQECSVALRHLESEAKALQRASTSADSPASRQSYAEHKRILLRQIEVWRQVEKLHKSTLGVMEQPSTSPNRYYGGLEAKEVLRQARVMLDLIDEPTNASARTTQSLRDRSTRCSA